MQHIECARLRLGIEVHRKFNLNRPPHLTLPVFLDKLQNTCQREHIVLENVGESDQLPSARIKSVAYHHVIRIISGSDEIERSVSLRILHMQLEQVESVVEREILPHILQVKRIEPCLRFTQGYLHLACLQHLRRMIRTNAQSQSAVNDVFSQTESQAYDSFFGQFIVDGIIIDGTCHPRNSRIITVAVLRPYHLLQNDCHFLLIDDIAGCLHVGLAVLIIYRSIYSLDGVAQHAKHLILVVQIRNHVRRVDAGKGLVVRIFKQTGRTDGYRRLHRIEKREEILHKPVGQLRAEKRPQYGFIVGIAQRHLIKLVRVHELIEHIGTQHHRFWNHDRSVFKLVKLAVALQQMVDKGKASPFSSERAFTDAGKIGITVKAVALEHSHNTLILHLAVFHDRLKNNLAMGIDVLQRLPRDLLQELGHRKNGARIQPAGNMIVADMVEERLGRNGKQHILQLFQVMHTRNLSHGFRVTENEVTETEILRYGLPKVDVHLFRVLVDEVGIQFAHILSVVFFRRLQDKRNKRVALPDFAQQLHAGKRILFALVRKAGVRNHPQHIVLVFLVQRPGFFIRARKHNFGTSAHAQGTLMGIQSLRSKKLALLEHKLIQIGKNRRIETDRILHQQNHLHAHFLYVALQVHLVFYQLDDRHEQVIVSQPAEHVLEYAQVFVFHPFPYAV